MQTTPPPLSLPWGDWFGIACTGALAAALAYASLLVAGAVAWFGDPNRTLLPLLPLFGIILVAAVGLRAADQLRLSERATQTVAIVGAAVTALVLIRLRVYPALAPGDFSWLVGLTQILDIYDERPHAILGMILISAIAWILGIGLARNAGDYESRRQQFTGFFIMQLLALALAAGVAINRDRLNQILGLYVPTYAVFGLITLAQVRLSEVRQRMTQAGASGRTFLMWRVVSSSIALGSVVIVYIAAAFYNTDSYAGPLSVLGALWVGLTDLLIAILGFFFTPVINLFAGLLQQIFTLGASRQHISLICPTPQPGASAQSCHPTLQLPTSSVGLPSDALVHTAYLVVIIVAMIIGASLLLTALRRRLIGSESAAVDESREIIAPYERRTGRHAVAETRDVSDPPPAGSVRAVYRDLLSAGQSEGYERRSDETPAEFARRLSAAGVSAADIALLTTAYAEERYGGVAPTRARVQRALTEMRSVIAHWRGKS